MSYKHLIFLFFLIILLFGTVGSYSSFGCEVYDEFSPYSLSYLQANPKKWDIRQDVEGQPLMDEYFIEWERDDFFYHTKQNVIGDRRVYLVPKRNFTTGDSIEYDVDLISRQGNYAQMVLLTGDQYIRIGMRGHDAGFDELGLAHMKLIFQKNNLRVERETPSGDILIDNLYLNNANGNYELYIGSFSGHNGALHMDYDNFVIC